MREILFRGKRSDNGKWITGDLWHNPYGKNGLAIVSPINNQGTIGGNNVIPETVGQSTGMTDKNGVKIFEGDITRGKSKSVYVVKYSHHIAGFMTEGTGVLSSSRPCMNYGTMNYYEVIGNIHDNPDLMEG